MYAKRKWIIVAYMDYEPVAYWTKRNHWTDDKTKARRMSKAEAFDALPKLNNIGRWKATAEKE